MKHALIALSLALALGPVAVLADDNTNGPPAPPALTQQQRQALEQTFETFHKQTEQMHQQFRTQVLASLSPTQRNAVANLIGQLAISNNPDPAAAAKQLDALLGQSGQQRILSLHTSFRTQMHALHQQMKAQLEKVMPQGMGMPGHEHHWNGSKPNERSESNPDAGTILLMVLSHPKDGMGDRHFPMMGPGGPPHR